jgi:RNase P subunit RPR2
MLNKEQPRKEIPQGRSFTPNYDRRLFPPLKNVECYECHNLGHVAARCRSRMVQERSSHPRYFRGYCFACNAYGHKAIDCDRRNMKNIRCYTCNNYGHKARECRSRFQNSRQEDHTSSQLQELKKTETERCGITQSADITDTGESESDEIQYSILHTLI